MKFSEALDLCSKATGESVQVSCEQWARKFHVGVIIESPSFSIYCPSLRISFTGTSLESAVEKCLTYFNCSNHPPTLEIDSKNL